MSITGYSQNKLATGVEVIASSNLSAPVFYWYLDGIYVGQSEDGRFFFRIAAGEHAIIEAIDSESASFDPVANQPTHYPSRRVIEWYRSDDAIQYFTIEQNKDSAGWISVSRMPAAGKWSWQWTSGQLADGSVYEWRITPYDRAGNAGTATTIGPEQIYRRPDPQDFAIAYDGGTGEVTYSEAS